MFGMRSRSTKSNGTGQTRGGPDRRASADVVTANVSTMAADSVMVLLCFIVNSILITVFFVFDDRNAL